jgi:hypothetical protein
MLVWISDASFSEGNGSFIQFRRGSPRPDLMAPANSLLDIIKHSWLTIDKKKKRTRGFEFSVIRESTQLLTIASYVCIVRQPLMTFRNPLSHSTPPSPSGLFKSTITNIKYCNFQFVITSMSVHIFLQITSVGLLGKGTLPFETADSISHRPFNMTGSLDKPFKLY